MTRFPRILSISLSVLISLAFCCSLRADDGFIGEGIVDVDKKTIPVIVRSGDATTLRLLKYAMSVHGGFRQVGSMSEASFAFAIDPSGQNGASLKIFSGIPESLKHHQRFTGSTSREAVLKALDRAVQKTSGRPGFFAGKLAWVGEKTGSTELYVSDALFGDVLQLTKDNVKLVRPRWSPDKSKLVFTSYKKSAADIYQIDLNTYRYEPIVRLTGTNMSARYSPDGLRMAMVLTGKGNAEVYVGDARGGYLRRLTRTNGDESAPCWSPDGRELCVASGQNGRVQLYVASSMSFPASLRRIPTNVSGYCAEPDWNPYDRNLLSFTAAEGNGFQIALYDFERNIASKITSEQGMAVESQWLNDGRHIIYSLKNGSSKRIVLFDTVTSRRSMISPPAFGDVSQASFVAP